GPDSWRGWKDRATICRGLRSIYQPLKPQPGFGEGILGALPPNRRCAYHNEQREANRRPCVSLDVPKAGARQSALAGTEGVDRLWTGDAKCPTDGPVFQLFGSRTTARCRWHGLSPFCTTGSRG